MDVKIKRNDTEFLNERTKKIHNTNHDSDMKFRNKRLSKFEVTGYGYYRSREK